MCACVFLHIYACVCTTAYIEARGQLSGVGLSFSSVGPQDLNQILGLGGKCFYPLRYIAGLSISYILSYSRFTSGQSETLNAEEIT